MLTIGREGKRQEFETETQEVLIAIVLTKETSKQNADYGKRQECETETQEVQSAN